MIGHRSGIFELAGAIHLHTEYSDGSVCYNELRSTAREVGLDYLVVTDHMTLKAKDEGEEGEEKGLYTLIGYEHNDSQEKNHYLAMGCSKVVSEQEDVRQYVAAIKEQGGIGFMAHPAEKRNYFKQYPSYPWTNWDIKDVDGIELWNQMSEWVENLKSWFSFIRILYPRRFHRGAPRKVLKNWDRINLKRFLSGIGGVDAHTFKHRFLGFTFYVFPLKVELKGIRNYIYLKENPQANDFKKTKDLMLKALKDGHGYIGYYRRGDAAGTLITLTDNLDKLYLPGRIDDVPVLPALINVSIPEKGTIKLIRNGKLVDTIDSDKASFKINSFGLYRIEVFKGKDTWIYSNPFPVGNYPIEESDE